MPATISPAADTLPQYLTIPDVCARLRLQKSAVYQLLGTGQLPSVKIGGARRVEAAALKRFCDSLTGGDAR